MDWGQLICPMAHLAPLVREELPAVGPIIAGHPRRLVSHFRIPFLTKHLEDRPIVFCKTNQMILCRPPEQIQAPPLLRNV